MKAHPLFPYFLEKCLAIPTSSHLLVNGFSVTSCRTFFQGPLTYLILVGGNGGREEIKMASASMTSANEQAKDVILVHTVQLKPMVKAQISGRMISSGISDVAITSVYSEKTHLKKFIMNKSQERTVFGGRQKLTSAMKQRPEK